MALIRKLKPQVVVTGIANFEDDILQALSLTTEFLEGNTSLNSQHYYGCLLHKLLAFQLVDRHPPIRREFEEPNSVKMIVASSAVSVFSTIALSKCNVDDDSSLIHMDVDQKL
ncbi:hypothetical protein Nepgr_029475 [Nepenthes gracilis]|uniref:Uncharacterized protein n=1 Tax=Nepenthes gracilis TaxID=150966 RepID=A0AAD3TFF3_NEPGR|nr:hypothetical protein Nepgr_029475 [Nepenthes gracilis]